METYHGIDGLEKFLNRSEVLICLLPLTPDTEGILGRGTFNRLPQGAAVINAGRGGHMVEEDLLAALDRGRVEVAVLDVFREEPLPTEHPLWDHPQVFITRCGGQAPEAAIFAVADASTNSARAAAEQSLSMNHGLSGLRRLARPRFARRGQASRSQLKPLRLPVELPL